MASLLKVLRLVFPATVLIIYVHKVLIMFFYALMSSDSMLTIDVLSPACDNIC